MFAEAWSYDPAFLAEYTYPENGGISVLDFPGREAMVAVFGRGDGSYAGLQDYLHLDSGIYQNPYELMTFYDNHDMPRMDADDSGFIDANNWLFTSRGIPVVYYGSEVGFRAGADQHAGNRDYYGTENIELAKAHPIRRALSEIAAVRKNSVALQRGLQVNLEFGEATAAFLRVYQKDGVRETALVLLNKSDEPTEFDISDWIFPALWRRAGSDDAMLVDAVETAMKVSVPAHGVRVYVTDEAPTGEALVNELQRLQMGVSQ
jgi:cyclomaltodextrin glucanotransferase